MSLFLQESPGLLSEIAELRQHFVFSANERGIQRDRRFARDEAGFDQGHGEMEALGKRARLRRALQHPAGVFDDGALDLDEVADEFARGPAAFGGARLPLVGRHGVGGGEELVLGASEIFEDGLNRRHGCHWDARGTKFVIVSRLLFGAWGWVCFGLSGKRQVRTLARDADEDESRAEVVEEMEGHGEI